MPKSVLEQGSDSAEVQSIKQVAFLNSSMSIICANHATVGIYAAL